MRVLKTAEKRFGAFTQTIIVAAGIGVAKLTRFKKSRIIQAIVLPTLNTIY